MQSKCLYQIARIESGKSFRQRIDDDPGGDCFVIQMRDVSQDNQAITGIPQSISKNEISANQLLVKGDILFVAKGNNNFAIEYDWNETAVAVSLFFVIRPDRKMVNPKYLTWYLNSSIAQSYFVENRVGASVGNIHKEVLEKLNVELPDMERQFQIARLNELMLEEKRTTNEYLEKKHALLRQTMINLLK